MRIIGPIVVVISMLLTYKQMLLARASFMFLVVVLNQFHVSSCGFEALLYYSILSNSGIDFGRNKFAIGSNAAGRALIKVARPSNNDMNRSCSDTLGWSQDTIDMSLHPIRAPQVCNVRSYTINTTILDDNFTFVKQ